MLSCSVRHLRQASSSSPQRVRPEFVPWLEELNRRVARLDPRRRHLWRLRRFVNPVLERGVPHRESHPLPRWPSPFVRPVVPLDRLRAGFHKELSNRTLSVRMNVHWQAPRHRAAELAQVELQCACSRGERQALECRKSLVSCVFRSWFFRYVVA